MSKKIIVVILIYIGLIFVATNAYASTGKMINENTRLREEASTSSDILDILALGEEAEILSDEGEWYKVKYNNKTGYIRKDMVNTEEEKSETSNETESKNTTNENTTTNVTETNKEEEKNPSSEEETKNENTIQVGYTGKFASSLNIKILPSINSSVIDTINENTEFTVKDVINKWCYIETQNSSGWALLSKINQQQVENNSQTEETEESKEEENKEEENKEETKKENNEAKAENTVKEETKTVTKYVSTEILNLREKPENEAKVITGLKINTIVTVVEEPNSTWSKVTTNGKTGYVASKYLSETKVDTSSRSENINRANDTTTQTETEEENTTTEDTSSSTTDKSSNSESNSTVSSGKGSEIVAYAKQFLGNPYVYGGTSLTNGCDCSGFVMSVYAHFGYSLPHSSSSMKSKGTAVSKSELQPGDIVCFTGHVGIYMGGNTFIHAANASKGIITTSLSSSYYVAKYEGARRIID